MFWVHQTFSNFEWKNKALFACYRSYCGFEIQQQSTYDNRSFSQTYFPFLLHFFFNDIHQAVQNIYVYDTLYDLSIAENKR